MGTAAVGLTIGKPAFAAAPESELGHKVAPGPVSITPSDPRYLDVQLRGYNKRLVSNPESVRIVGTTAHVVQAVNEAVAAGKRIAIRSGGHCLDGLVDNADTKVIIDFTEMRSVTFDADRNAFAVEPGATLGEIYRTLDYGWGVTLPGGVCPVVGAGGHISGNGFGALSRQHGLIADHLYAIEVVVVGSSGKAEAVVATRETNDSNRDLWWAHTGTGGGNFGVVTKFWMRSPSTNSTTPSALLPKAPNAVMSGRAVFNWADLTEAGFVQLVKNWSTWVEANSAPGSKGTQLHGALSAPRKEKGQVFVVGQVDPTISGNEALLDSYLAAMKASVPAVPTIVKSGKLPWLTTTINVPDSSVAQGITGPPRWKSKVGHLRAKFTHQQVSTAFKYLTGTDYTNTAASFSLTTYGGQINALAPSATATPHRFTLMMASVSTAWDVPADDAKHLKWAREFYRDLFAATGGVPVPNDQADGLHVNWPDLDLLDTTWNSSGWAVQKLLHKENYPKLQQIKSKYDPRNVFRHGVSVEPLS